MERRPAAREDDHVCADQLRRTGDPRQLHVRLDVERVEVGRIGEVGKSDHCDAQRVPGTRRRPIATDVERVLDAEQRIVAQVGEHAEHRDAGPTFELVDPTVEQRGITAELVEDDASDRGAQHRRKQIDRTVRCGERSAPLDVDHQDRAHAGGVGEGQVDEIAVEDWLAVCNTNITGMFLCARAAFGLMRRQDPQGGRIINNGSISAHAPRPGSVPYTMSKHAVTGLTRTLGLDGRAFNIACGQIDIGNALTEMASGFTKGTLQADGQMRVEPVMDVAHVAAAVLNMAQLPLEVNVPFITLMARDMPFIGRG